MSSTVPTPFLRNESALVNCATPWLRQRFAGGRHALDRGEELTLVHRARAGERQALERLVQANLRLILREARRCQTPSDSFDDLVQEGILAFVQALSSYDERRGFRLMTYALHRVRRAVAAASHDSPTSVSCPEFVSLDAPADPGSDSALLDLLEDPAAADPQDDTLQRLDGVRLRALLSELPDRERRVVEERFGFGDGCAHTVDETSRRLRLPRERVRRIESAAMRRLRDALLAEQCG